MRAFIYICAIFLLVFAHRANAQPLNIDSLKQLVPITDNIDDKIQLLFDIAWEYKSSDPSQAIDYANQCMELSESVNDVQGIASCYSIIGVTYRIIGDFEKALDNSFKSLEITQSLKEPEREAIALNNVGNVYYYMGDYQNALVYYQKAIQIKEELGDELSTSSSYNNIANVYRDIGKLDSSLIYHQMSLEIDKRLNNRLGEAMNLNNIGMVFYDMGHHLNAQPYLHDAITMLLTLNEANNLAFAYNSLATNSIALDSLSRAEIYANKCLDLALEIGLKKEIRSSMRSLSEISEKQGNESLALFYYKKYTAMHDSILNESVREKVLELGIKYDVHQQQKEIKLLNQEKEIEKLTTDLTLKNRNYFIGFLIGAVLIIVIISLFWFQRTKYRSRLKVNELEQKFLRSRMNPHFLFNALGSIQSCILTNDTDLAYSYHSKFAKLLRLILLHSDEETVTLKDDLEALRLYLELERFRTEDKFDFTISIDKKVDQNNVKIPPMLIQPFIENAIWHGVLPKKLKGNISLSIRALENAIQIEIIDDGVGLNYKKKSLESKHKSLGMDITEKRLDQFNLKHKHKGSLVIEELTNENNVPCGTRIYFEISTQ